MPGIVVASIILAIALDVALMRWLRAYWQQRGIGRDRGQPVVRIGGSFSPVLTLLKYRHLPKAARPQYAVAWPRQLQHWARGKVWLLGAGICLLAVAGQQQLMGEQFRDPVTGYGLLALATVAFLLVTRTRTPAGGEIERNTQNSSTGSTRWINRRSVRTALIASSLGVGLVNVLLIDSRKSGENYWAALALWIVSLALYLAALVPAIRSVRARGGRPGRMFLILASITVLFAFAVRFYELGRVPVVMGNDEADVGRQTIAVLEGRLANMFKTHGGYGTLEFFAMAIPVRLWGPTRFALRFLSAVGGWLAIPLLLVFARRMFGSQVALVSAALLAVSHLAVQFSRVSITASTFDPLLASLGLYLVYRSLQTRSLFTWGLAGLALGITIYGYVGARVIPPVAALFIASLAVVNRPMLRGNWRGILVLATGAFLCMAPMLPWILRNPNGFNDRLNQVGVLQSGYLLRAAAFRGVPAWQIAWEQFRDALLNFNFYNVGMFYEANVPMLGPLTAPLFVLGVVYSLTRWRDTRILLLNLWFWIPLLVGQVMMIYPAGAAYRTLSLLPPVCIMAAMALIKLADMAVPRLQRRQAWVTAAVAIALVFEGGWNTHYYFGVWALRYRYSDFSTQAASLIADYMHELGPEYQTYVLSTFNFQAKGWAAMDYIAKGQRHVDIEGALPAALPAVWPGQRTAFIFAPQRAGELPIVESAFPGGQSAEHYLGDTLYFVTYELPGHSASTRSQTGVQRLP
jgi:hypothetical protein